MKSYVTTLPKPKIRQIAIEHYTSTWGADKEFVGSTEDTITFVDRLHLSSIIIIFIVLALLSFWAAGLFGWIYLVYVIAKPKKQLQIYMNTLEDGRIEVMPSHDVYGVFLDSGFANFVSKLQKEERKEPTTAYKLGRKVGALTKGKDKA
jgi:hypothetical protein